MNARVGEMVTRVVDGQVNRDLIVTAVTAKVVICGPWTFCRETGQEIDKRGDRTNGSHIQTKKILDIL